MQGHEQGLHVQGGRSGGGGGGRLLGAVPGLPLRKMIQHKVRDLSASRRAAKGAQEGAPLPGGGWRAQRAAAPPAKLRNYLGRRPRGAVSRRHCARRCSAAPSGLAGLAGGWSTVGSLAAVGRNGRRGLGWLGPAA